MCECLCFCGFAQQCMSHVNQSICWCFQIFGLRWRFRAKQCVWMFNSYEKETTIILDHFSRVVRDTNWIRPDVNAVSPCQPGVSSACPLPLLCCHFISFPALLKMPPPPSTIFLSFPHEMPHLRHLLYPIMLILPLLCSFFPLLSLLSLPSWAPSVNLSIHTIRWESN